MTIKLIDVDFDLDDNAHIKIKSRVKNKTSKIIT